MDTNDKEQIKIVDTENKYLTMVDNKAKMKSKMFSNNQSVSYSAQGELIVNDNCLTVKPDNKVKFDKCTKEKNQLWNMDNDKIYPHSAPNMCLFSDNEKVELKDCFDDNGSNDENIKMSVEDQDTERTSDYQLKKYKGKTIVLVESDNPWYLNKDSTIPMKYKKDIELTKKQYRNNADYGSHHNTEFEHFSEKNNNKEENDSISQNQIILLLLMIVVILFVYKKILNSSLKYK